ncbi:MAG: arginine N-succinyltransferase [Phycisphaerales bacterium]
MFVIRNARPEDADTLLKLAKMVHFINLPADPDIIAAKIQRSRSSFAGKATNEREREFMFVLEDSETGNVIGTSTAISCMSWPGKPHIYFNVRKREHYSKDLQTGAVHVTMQLETDESGPSEIGGLILSPSYRGHKHKLGSFLSLIRFHFVGLHPQWFSERMIAEMMAPLTPDSRNTLWEYLGRRFINLTYAEADRFCQHSKEFMTSLLPSAEIYVSLLPPEARNLIGKVGTETRPALAMLESLGFQYEGHVDPFDGGPYLSAVTRDISVVRDTCEMQFGGISERNSDTHAMVSVHRRGTFTAIKSACTIDAEKKAIYLPSNAVDRLQLEPGESLGVTESTRKPTQPQPATESRQPSPATTPTL